MNDDRTLPHAGRSAEDVQGHWLLARLGKRVLRPGGAGLTRRLLDAAGLPASDVVELAPGLGRTAAWVMEARPNAYVGVERTRTLHGWSNRWSVAGGRCVSPTRSRRACPTRVPTSSSAKPMLTMQTDRGKRAIIAEAVRLLRPGGRYAIHELGLVPDDIDNATADGIRQALARTIRVNARPLTAAEWRGLLTDAGLVVDWVGTAPMALLDVRRNIADEGVGGTLRIVRNVAGDRDARSRVLAMRRTFRRHADSLTGIALVAHLPLTTKDTDDQR